eukprot:4811702-Pyramimonas_sp.AAC.1
MHPSIRPSIPLPALGRPSPCQRWDVHPSVRPSVRPSIRPSPCQRSGAHAPHTSFGFVRARCA